MGITSDLYQRMEQHKSGAVRGFASTFKMDRLVYYEETTDVMAAIEREKQIKAWRREKRIALINSMNPRWEDLSEAWNDPREPGQDLRRELVPTVRPDDSALDA